MRLIKYINQIKEDINTIYENDPAAVNLFEVLFCYPGLHALILHRVAHKLLHLRIPFIPRLISNISDSGSRSHSRRSPLWWTGA